MSEVITELETLFPTGKQVTIGTAEAQKTITITPFKFGQLGAAMKAAQPISAALMESFGSPNQMDAMMSLMAESGDHMVNLVVVGTGLPRKEVEQLGLDDALSCMIGVLEVNGDFFVRKVLPTLKGNMAGLAALVPSAGQTS